MEKISVVIPVFNEEGNLPRLFEELKKVVADLPCPAEMIFIDDGSKDGSLEIIKALATANPEVKYISFAQNTGQSAALYAGFQAATGDTIITMDADLQNDPADIFEMLRYYGDYEMVNGWRFQRQDSLSQKIGSKIGNFVRNKLTWECIRDTGCSLKIMKATMAKRIPMHRGLHRFLPTLMRLQGARVIEVKVNHRPRFRGVSNYTNMRRGIEGLYDVIAVRWMIKRHLNIKIKEDHV